MLVKAVFQSEQYNPNVKEKRLLEQTHFEKLCLTNLVLFGKLSTFLSLSLLLGY